MCLDGRNRFQGCTRLRLMLRVKVCSASHVILPMTALNDDKSAKKVNLRLWTPKTLTLSCVNKSGASHVLLQCPIKGDTLILDVIPCFATKTFPPQFWKQLCLTASVKVQIFAWQPKLWIQSTSQLASSQFLRCQDCLVKDYSRRHSPIQFQSETSHHHRQHRAASCDIFRIGLVKFSPPHSVINGGSDKQDWLTLLHLIASHQPAHLQHDYTTILMQVGDVTPFRSFPTMREAATTIMIGKYKQGDASRGVARRTRSSTVPRSMS